MLHISSKESIFPTPGKDVVFNHCWQQLPPTATAPSLGAASKPHQPAVHPGLVTHKLTLYLL